MTDATIGPCQLMLGDCLERMAEIPDGSIDAIISDLPYGTTACSWDSVIPFEPLWAHYKRVTKPNAAIVLTASQPFTSALVMSNTNMFRYALVWDKVNRYTGALQANRAPMRRHEDVIIFYRKQPTYNKQFRKGAAYKVTRTGGHGQHTGRKDAEKRREGVNDGNHNPCSVIAIKGDNKIEAGHHPTQKPVALMEYLIRTYTDEGETVLDSTMGSGTTGVACVNTGRQFIGIEKNIPTDDYHAIACQRVRDAIAAKAEADRQGNLFSEAGDS